MHRSRFTRHLVTDAASSVLGWTGNRSVYSPFGVGAGASPSAALGFSGQRRASAGGYLLGNGRRHYLPSLMRFCQPDVLSPFSRGGINAYAYCAAEPVNRYDPDGLFFHLIPNLLGAGTSTVFLTSVFNKTADTIVDLSVNVMRSPPGTLARLESVGTFWGASAGMVANGAGIAAGGVTSLGSASTVGGMVASVAYSASGAPPAVVAGISWVGKAYRARISPVKVAVATLDEISGLRYVTKRSFPSVRSSPDIEQGLEGRYIPSRPA